MRNLLIMTAMLGGLATIVGCDWTSGGGVDSWSARYNWVNFSGVYRGLGGGLLVTDYTATPGTPGVTNSVSGEIVERGDGSKTIFSGVLSKKPIVPGSLSISETAITLTDDGSGTLSGGGANGTIDYGTGAWSIDLGYAPVNNNPIRATYQYTVSGTQGSGSAGSGSSGASIFSFTAFQEGELLRLTDNNGRTYDGKFGSIRSSGGMDQDNSTVPSIGETVIAQFSVKGIAASGLEVQIVGTMQGVVGGAGEGSFFLNDRRMFGTWIENGGRTGDVNGQASPVRLDVAEQEAAP